MLQILRLQLLPGGMAIEKYLVTQRQRCHALHLAACQRYGGITYKHEHEVHQMCSAWHSRIVTHHRYYACQASYESLGLLMSQWEIDCQAVHHLCKALACNVPGKQLPPDVAAPAAQPPAAPKLAEAPSTPAMQNGASGPRPKHPPTAKTPVTAPVIAPFAASVWQSETASRSLRDESNLRRAPWL